MKRVNKNVFLGAVLFACLFLGNVFAAELNSGNIVTTYGCATNATTCDLSAQWITSIATNTFANHTILNTLILDSNHISSLQPWAFSGLLSLVNLSIAYNDLTSITPGAFFMRSVGSPRLRQLTLIGNKINTISSGDFSGGLSELTYLDLRDNQLVAIPSDAFILLGKLATLYLGYNHIVDISSWNFSLASGLVSLDLSYNNITSIEPGDFNGLSKLTTLDLSSNNILSVEYNDFTGISKITTFNLSYNNIMSIDTNTFLSGNWFSKLTSLDTSFNCANAPDLIQYRLTSSTMLDSANCVPTNSAEIGDYISSLEMNGYISNGDYEVWILALGFNQPWSINTLLAGTIMQSYLWDANLWVWLPDTIPAEAQYQESTALTVSGNAFTGILTSPILFDTGNVPGMTGVLSILRFGALDQIVDFDTPITLRMPALWADVDDTIGIYTSEETNIYGSQWPNWSFEQTGTVYDNGWNPYVEFTTSHASRYVLGTPFDEPSDTTAPVWTITYSPTSWTITSGNVVATISLDEAWTITNNSWLTWYTFTENGTFTFEFADLAGNTWSATATVNRIDTTKPTATITYSPTSWTTTSRDVVATISLGETGTITNNDWLTWYTFTGNGTFTFEFADLAGNTWSATATVTRIDKAKPTATVTYNITWTTNQDVIATVTWFSESITWLNFSTHTFTGNGTFIFTFQDLAGNTGNQTATVTRIDKTVHISNWWPGYLPLPTDTTWLLCTAFSAELNSAFTFAFTNGITTIKDCKQANLEGKLQRSHLAKMITQFAVKVMKMKPDITKTCSFSDIWNETAEIQLYIKTACQLGLMGYDDNGKQSETFNPFGIVDRAQFGTILSRVLRGTKYNWGDPYYVKHLNALKADWIMTNISQPLVSEIRGRVMLMLMRIGK